MALSLLATTPLAYQIGDIKHFLVIFYENRAFDHIFGCSADELPGIDGVTPDMGNWLDPNDHSKGFVKVGCGEATYVCSHDEDHSFTGTTKEIWGPAATPAQAAHAPYPNVTMSGLKRPYLHARYTQREASHAALSGLRTRSGAPTASCLATRTVRSPSSS